MLSTETHYEHAVGSSDLSRPSGVRVTALLIKVRCMDVAYHFVRRVPQLHITCHH